MKPINLRVIEIIMTGNENFIEQLISQVPFFDTSHLNLEEKKALLIGYITPKEEIDIVGINRINEIETNKILAIRNANGLKEESRLLTVYSKYAYNKYNKNESLINDLKKDGLKEIYLKHFININDIDNVLCNIIKMGGLIKYSTLLGIIDTVYNYRICRDVLRLKQLDKIEYGRQSGMSKTLNNLNNIQRKIKYKGMRMNKSSEFDNLFTDLQITNLNNGIDVINIVKDVFGEKHKGLRNYLHTFFMKNAEAFDRKTFILIYAPLFHLLFEDDKDDGLLTEESFNRLYLNSRNNAFKYDGNYYKYYSTRIKTLTGF